MKISELIKLLHMLEELPAGSDGCVYVLDVCGSETSDGEFSVVQGYQIEYVANADCGAPTVDVHLLINN